MDANLLLLLILLVLFPLGFGSIIYFLQKPKEEAQSLKLMTEWVKQINEQTQALRHELQTRLDKNTDTLQNSLDKTNKTLGDRLDRAAEVIGQVQKNLGQVAEINRRIAEFQDALRAPKTRGEIGEKVMYDLLRQIIPQAYVTFQYEFHNGQKVDAAVKTDSGIIPIDSKFPVENFKKMTKAETDEEREQAKKDFMRDVKKHIDDIAKKYILPDEGTCDFAIMYITSESVAYEIVVNNAELSDYAHLKHVIIVSPQQFNHFLQVIYTTLQVQQINEQAQNILAMLKGIRIDSQKFGEDFRLLNKHLTNAKSAADSATTSFNQLSGKIENIQALEKTPEIPLEQIPKGENELPLL